MPVTLRTHYILALARRDAQGWQEAACGEYITPEQHSTEPTCWGCRMWIENLDVIEPDDTPVEQVTR